MGKVGGLISIESGKKTLSDGKCVLSDIHLDLDPGESLSLIGKSGSGKSTLLSIIGLLDVFDSGTMKLNGIDACSMHGSELDRFRGTSVGFIFQRFSLIPHLSVLENVMAPLRHAGQTSQSKMKKSALEKLEAVQLPGFGRRKPRQLSGGEQQRVAIARALVRNPALILADEPTGSLDTNTGDSVMNLLLNLVSSDKCGLIVVTHDVDIANRTKLSCELTNGRIRNRTLVSQSRASHRRLGN